MQPALTQSPTAWMSASQTQAVMRALGDGKALFVGGCVRDWLLGRTVVDIDIATTLKPVEVQAVLNNTAIKWIPTGIDHGTITAVVDGKTFEITTLRKDVETDGRRAMVKFTDQWAEDAERRDFTINALYADGAGNVFDPQGQGLNDLKNKKLRFVGAPAARIAEDYLRILRYFRFAAQLGWVLDDEAALNACEAAAPNISGVSKERITQEMLKLLSTLDPVSVLGVMHERGIAPALLKNFDAAVWKDLVSTHPLTRLSLLSDPEEHLVLSNDQRKHLAQLGNGIKKLDGDTAPDIKKLIYYLKNMMAFEVYALWCSLNKKEPQAALLDLIQNWQAPVFPVTGENLIKEGYKPGPELGAELKRREEEWLATNF